MNEFKVMLVDDEKDFLETLCKRLTKRKLDVTSANSGREAIAKIQEFPVDVVVLDVRMPGMNGIETLKEIKKIKPLVEVIMLTAHADVQVAIEGMELGAFDYLMKPMEIDDLLYKLQDAYRKKWCREETEKCELPPSLQLS